MVAAKVGAINACPHPLPERLAHEDSRQSVDEVGENGAQDQEPEVHLGIPEDPSKEEDRSGHVPQDHRSVSDPIEGSVGEGVGYDILFPGNVLQPVRDLDSRSRFASR